MSHQGSDADTSECHDGHDDDDHPPCQDWLAGFQWQLAIIHPGPPHSLRIFDLAKVSS